MRKAFSVALAIAGLSFAAVPALASEPANPHKFVGSENVEPKITGESEEFVLKPFTIECEKAKGTTAGAPTFPTKTLDTVIKYSKCTATAVIGKAEYKEMKAKFATPVTINYHANGYVELGSGGTIKEGKLEGATPVEITVKGPFKCTIDLAAGTYPANATKKPESEFEAVKFVNKETKVEKGKKSEVVKTLELVNSIEKMPYEIEGEFCEALPKTEFTNGQYHGSLLAGIKKGSIGWE